MRDRSSAATTSSGTSGSRRRRRTRPTLRRRCRRCSPTASGLAYRAVEARDRDALAALLDDHPELVHARGTNGNDLLGMAGSNADLASIRLLLERGADVKRGNDYGWTALHQAGYSNHVDLARLL